MSRIVSLLPSSTEIVNLLGYKDQLVGRSHECDFPAGIDHLPALTAPKFKTDVSSLEINDSVNEVLEYGLSVYKLDVDLLEQLKPDFIITQSQCEVCAVSMKDVEDAVCQLVSSQPEIINLEPNSLQDVFSDIERVGKALGVPEESLAYNASVRKQFEEIKRKTKGLPSPKVAAIEWMSPLMLAGNWVPELIEIAGGSSVLAAKDEHSHYIEWGKIQQEDPDVIAIMPCGFSIDRSMEEIELLTELPGWSDMKAVKEGKVFVTDGNQFFNRPGPRLFESVEILTELMYPDLFAPKHLGTGYSKL